MISPRLLLIPVMLISQSWALVPGAKESFPTLANAEAWTLFDFSDDELVAIDRYATDAHINLWAKSSE